VKPPSIEEISAGQTLVVLGLAAAGLPLALAWYLYRGGVSLREFMEVFRRVLRR
jgi:hypothetical protein